ncbi:MAG: hypothetical protein KC800_16000, partial [Candidatus Eremiobacteraeota bacterium]|nr:hypothetical protein [Candidatus Eremiobacteraeota bacterium]
HRLLEAISQPGIAHFAGHFKPWRFKTRGSFASRYETVLHQKPFGFQPNPPNAVDRLLSLYDLYLRDSLYPLERALWNKGLF